jgi:hypothetical protein
MPVKPLIIAFVLMACWLREAGASDDCPDLLASAETVTLAGVDAAGDPVLADGRTLRLVGTAPRQDAAEAARFAAELVIWRGRELRLVVTGEADRWSRLPARLVIVPDSAKDEFGDLATLVIGAGAATRLPDAAHSGCGVPAPAASAPAKRTPPQQPATAVATPLQLPAGVLNGHDVAALRAHMGRLVAVEGRVASVGERTQRTYLNFSRRRGEAGAIMLPRRVWREMQGAGWTASGLSGKRIRARGILSGQDGLLLDVTSALALELID